MPQDANVEVPDNVTDSTASDNENESNEENEMEDNRWNGIMDMQAAKHLEGLEHTGNGARYLHETMRLGHERRIDVVSFREATGIRHTTEAGKTSTQSNANAGA